jgi:predicted phage tail protein
MSETLRVVRLYGKMGARFGRRFLLAVSSPAEAVRALCSQLPGFEQYLMGAKDKGIGFAVFVGRRNLSEGQLIEPTGSEEIRIAPIIMGAKNGGVFQIIMGAVLIVVGVFITGLSWGAAAPIGSALIGMGISMIVGGVIQLLSPQPKAPKAQDRVDNKPSYAFNGPLNTQAQGNPVPVLYGELTVGSAVISAGISVQDGLTAPTAPPAGSGSFGGGGGGGSAWSRIIRQIIENQSNPT